MIRIAGPAVVCIATALAGAQTSTLFITQLDSTSAVAVRNGGVVFTWGTQNPGETAIAVAGTIRTAGNYWFGSGAGAEYDLLGNPLGPTYNIVGGGNWFDGTTDGVSHNYAVQHNGDYNLYRFDREWGSPEVMFNVGFATSGITYDQSNGTFWVTDSLSLLVRNIDSSGTVLASFTASGGNYAYGIAMDPADRTLWVGGYNSNVIYQYDTSGNLLSTVAVSGITHAFGMEFAVPAPGVATLLALGGLAASRRRRA